MKPSLLIVMVTIGLAFCQSATAQKHRVPTGLQDQEQTKPTQGPRFRISSAVANQRPIKIRLISPEEFAKLQIIKGIVKNGPQDEADTQTLLDLHKPLDASGRRITGALYDRENNLLIGSSSAQVNVHNKYRDKNGDLSFVVSGRSSSGSQVKLEADRLALFKPDGSAPIYQIETLAQAAPPTVLEILIDTSGSMRNHMKTVKAAVEHLLRDMPSFVDCGVITFGGSVTDFGANGYAPCDPKNFDLSGLKAIGGTPLFAALKLSYTKLGSPQHMDSQVATIIVSDGAPEDHALLESVKALKGDTTTLVFFIGNKPANAEKVLAPVATHFVTAGNDAAAKLKAYFDGYRRAYQTQSVIKVKGVAP